MTVAASATNTLIVAALPGSIFTHEPINALKDRFSQFGELLFWTSLPSFGRAIVIYGGDSEEATLSAKTSLDKVSLYSIDSSLFSEYTEKYLRVYYGPHTSEHVIYSLLENRKEQLELPCTDRNFLISPPGSPPVGWVQTREDGPNNCALAEDLIAALEQVNLEQFGIEDNDTTTTAAAADATDYEERIGQVENERRGGDDDYDDSEEEEGPPPRSSPQQVCSPRSSSPSLECHNRTSSSSSATDFQQQQQQQQQHTFVLSESNQGEFTTPSVFISHPDGEENQDGLDPNRITLKNTPFGVPRRSTGLPQSITSVKATVDSMNGPVCPPTFSFEETNDDGNGNDDFGATTSPVSRSSRITPTSRPPLAGY